MIEESEEFVVRCPRENDSRFSLLVRKKKDYNSRKQSIFRWFFTGPFGKIRYDVEDLRKSKKLGKMRGRREGNEHIESVSVWRISKESHRHWRFFVGNSRFFHTCVHYGLVTFLKIEKKMHILARHIQTWVCIFNGIEITGGLH